MVNSGWTVIDRSLIRHKKLSFRKPDEFDWIFFSSPKGVRYYLESEEIPENVRIAAVGAATAQAVVIAGRAVDYIGESTDTLLIAADFNELVVDRSILFPCSARSRQNLQKVIGSANHVESVFVYDTVEDPASIEPCDTYVFTSPANVRSFFLLNEIPVGSRVIAIGNSTAKELTHYRINAEIPPKPSVSAIISNIIS